MKKRIKPVLVRFDGCLVNMVDQMAEDFGLSRDRAIQNLVQVGLDDYRLASRIGMTSLVKYFDKNRLQLQVFEEKKAEQ